MSVGSRLLYRQRSSRTARVWRRTATTAISIAVALVALTGPSVRGALNLNPILTLRRNTRRASALLAKLNVGDCYDEVTIRRSSYA